MVKFEKIYESNLLLVHLISADYVINYEVKEYNAHPAISFPIKAGFRYKSGKLDRIVDTNTILIERENTEFRLSKYGQFTHDSTLSFQILGCDYDFSKLKILKDDRAGTFKRTPQIDTLIRNFIANYLSKDTSTMDEIVDELFFKNVIFKNLHPANIAHINPWKNIYIDNAKNYIHDNYSENISIADIAASAHLSIYHFSRIFKLVTGYSPYDYLLRVRIAQAKKLLGQDDAIGSIAFRVGFNSIENFSYCFKKVLGTSPIQYKNSKISKA